MVGSQTCMPVLVIRDQAFAWLEKDFERRSAFGNHMLHGGSLFDDLRSDPRYADLMRRMGL